MEEIIQPFEIYPKIGIGPFKLSTNISEYAKFKLAFYESDDITGWDTYDFENVFSIYTERGIIVSIACRTLCVWNGAVIVGANYSDFLKKLQPTNVTHEKIYMPDDEDYQDVYDIDDWGMQLWCRYDVILTVFCACV